MSFKTVNGVHSDEDIRQNEELATRIGKPRAFIDFVLNLLESNNHIKVFKHTGGQSHVWEISASLRWAIQQAQ